MVVLHRLVRSRKTEDSCHDKFFIDCVLLSLTKFFYQPPSIVCESIVNATLTLIIMN
jgi:hypothetical protein